MIAAAKFVRACVCMHDCVGGTVCVCVCVIVWVRECVGGPILIAAVKNVCV